MVSNILKKLLVILFSLVSLCGYSQTRLSITKGLQKCFEDDNVTPKPNCFVTTNANGEQIYVDSMYMDSILGIGGGGEQVFYNLGTLMAPVAADDSVETTNVKYILFNGLSGGLNTMLEILKESTIEFDIDTTGVEAGDGQFLIRATPMQIGNHSNVNFNFTRTINFFEGDSISDDGWAWGLNAGVNGREDNDKIALYDAYESHFSIDDREQTERHEVFGDTLGNQWRVMTSYYDHGNPEWFAKAFELKQLVIREPNLDPGDDPTYFQFLRQDDEQTSLRMFGSGSNSTLGIEMYLRTVEDEENFQIFPYASLPSTAEMYVSGFNALNMKRARIMNDWGTLHGSDGNPAYLLGGEDSYGGVVFVEYDELIDSLIEHGGVGGTSDDRSFYDYGTTDMPVTGDDSIETTNVKYVLFNGLDGGLATKIEMLKEGIIQFSRDTTVGGKELMRFSPLVNDEGEDPFYIGIQAANNLTFQRRYSNFAMGWNLAPDGTRYDDTDIAFGMAIEGPFEVGGKLYAEHHNVFIDSTGYHHRPYSQFLNINDPWDWHGAFAISDFYFRPAYLDNAYVRFTLDSINGLTYSSIRNPYLNQGFRAILDAPNNQVVIENNGDADWEYNIYGFGGVGVGNQSPFAELSVTGDVGIYSSAGTSGGSPIGGSLYIGDANYFNSSFYDEAPGLSAIYNATMSVASDLAFYTYVGSRSEAMRIKYNGFLGIGTTDAQQRLHVQGEARITGSDGTALLPMGRDADGDISSMTEGWGINYTSGTIEVDSSQVATQYDISGLGYTDEQAQDAVGGMVNSTLTYTDATPLLEINLNNANTWTADITVPADDYGVDWNGVNEVPTKNDVYDKMETKAPIDAPVFTTSLTVPTAAAPTPTADGSIAYATTQDRWVAGGAGGLTGSFPRVLAVGHPAESKTNSTAADQDYTSIFSIPANYLIENKVLRITLMFEYVAGTSTVTKIEYLKLGSTKVYTSGTANVNNGITRSMAWTFLVFGTAAAGGSANVETVPISLPIGINDASANNTDQPVALATNGILNIIPGITYSGTGSTETHVLRAYLVEELN